MIINNNPFISPPPSKDSPWRIATIKEVVSGKPTIQFDNETATEKSYKFLSSYTPTVNDRVLVAWKSGTGVILGSF